MFNQNNIANIIQMQSNENINFSPQIQVQTILKTEKSINIIKQTKQAIREMNKQQKFQKALNHVKDALNFRRPRPDAYFPNQPYWFNLFYKWQVSYSWTLFLIILTYIYFYIIILDPEEYYTSKLITQLFILTMYWLDVGMFLYHKSYEKIKLQTKFQRRFYLKIIVLIILVIDFLIFAFYQNKDLGYLRLFRFFRGLLPIFYDAILRKSFQALLLTYKDIIVLIIFYTCVITFFALIANQIVRYTSNMSYDEYKQNYPDFIRTIFIIYALSTYDSFPDNQYPAIRIAQWTWIFFLAVVILFMFFFSTIQGSLIYQSFKKIKKNTILMDQIRQQHSLILAFVTLSENDNHMQKKRLIEFLKFMYNDKSRYLDYIVQICVKLNTNKKHDDSIQIKQFMKLGKILTKYAYMTPPQFKDFKLWVSFRKFINEKIQLREAVISKSYKVTSNLLIVITFINCIIYFFSESIQFDILDIAFQVLFGIDLVLKIIGLGYIQFFQDRWNKLDFVLVLTILIIQGFPDQVIPHSISVLLKMIRIFRITSLIKLIEKQKNANKEVYSKYKNKDSLYNRFIKLISQTAIIMPIILKFFPLLLLASYYWGILGMQIFQNVEKTSPSDNYGTYAEFSHFKRFSNSQYLIVQILAQGGWSALVNDYAYRTQLYFPVVLFFIFCHITITIVIGSLLKALIWQAYSNIQTQFQQRLKQQQSETNRLIQQKLYQQQNQKVQVLYDRRQFIRPNTIIKKSFLDKKIDKQIFKRLKQLYQRLYEGQQSNNPLNNGSVPHPKTIYSCSVQQPTILSQLFKNKILRCTIKQQNSKYCQRTCSKKRSTANRYRLTSNKKFDRNLNYGHAKRKLQWDQLNQKQNNNEQENRPQKSFKNNPQQIFKKLASKPLINQEAQKTQKTKQIKIYQDKWGDIFCINQMHQLLQIQSKRDATYQIFKYFIENKIVQKQQFQQEYKHVKFYRTRHINKNWIIRKMFLGYKNQQMINNFQIEYFSDIYGHTIKDIYKVDLKPILSYSSLLIYTLKNIFRYPQINSSNFFQLFTTIQDNISRILLKKGSLFKFVYQIKNFKEDYWFTLTCNKYKAIKVNFIKTGLWVHDKNMKAQQIYYGQDLFNWQNQKIDEKSSQKILKSLYQTFQGLAIGLKNQNDFFTTNPKTHIYDLYSYFIKTNQNQNKKQKNNQPAIFDRALKDINIENNRSGLKKRQTDDTDDTDQKQNENTQNIEKSLINQTNHLVKNEKGKTQQNRKLQISKIMIVVLSKQNQRQNPLDYYLSDIQIQNKKKSFDFRFDQSQNQTYQKLQNFQLHDHQKIIQNQGISQNYIINIIKQLQDCLKLYKLNLINHVQTVLNEQFHNVRMN